MRVIEKVKTASTRAILTAALCLGHSSPHPLYSLDLAPRDFQLFIYLKQFLGGTHMRSDEEVKKTIKHWFSGLAADFYSAHTHTETPHTIP
jgi:hypothetical protein